MPFWAERAISGSAALRAATASSCLQPAMASSALRKKVRIRDRHDLLISVRAAILRADFLAEEVFAIVVLFVRCAPFVAQNPGDEMKSAAPGRQSWAVYRQISPLRQPDSGGATPEEPRNGAFLAALADRSQAGSHGRPSLRLLAHR